MWCLESHTNHVSLLKYAEFSYWNVNTTHRSLTMKSKLEIACRVIHQNSIQIFIVEKFNFSQVRIKKNCDFRLEDSSRSRIFKTSITMQITYICYNKSFNSSTAFLVSDWFTKLRLSADIPIHLIQKCIATCWNLKKFLLKEFKRSGFNEIY